MKKMSIYDKLYDILDNALKHKGSFNWLTSV